MTMAPEHFDKDGNPIYRQYKDIPKPKVMVEVDRAIYLDDLAALPVMLGIILVLLVILFVLAKDIFAVIAVICIIGDVVGFIACMFQLGRAHERYSNDK